MLQNSDLQIYISFRSQVKCSHNILQRYYNPNIANLHVAEHQGFVLQRLQHSSKHQKQI